MKSGISLIFLLAAMLGLTVAQAQAPVTPEFVLANNDLNKDGVITREEAVKAGRQLAQTWDFFDTNRDNKVTVEELKAGIAARVEQTAPAGSAPAAATPAPAAGAAKQTQPPAAKAPAAPKPTSGP